MTHKITESGACFCGCEQGDFCPVTKMHYMASLSGHVPMQESEQRTKNSQNSQNSTHPGGISCGLGFLNHGAAVTTSCTIWC